ncbi:lysozyme [Bacteroidia bacterium]|nr:lysozyme [Bacteroidia bacterium]
MAQGFYKLPIRFNTVSENSVVELLTCSELESIDRNIELIITTCPGEHKFNKNFGCHIWDMDFELVFSRKKWEEDFTAHILQAVRDFEQRLKEITVFLHIMEVARQDALSKTTAIKKRVEVFVNGRLVSTNETCGFKYVLYLGPLSTE